MNSETVRTRFAPSPTGFMHVGGVRTALYAWLFARKHGGQFILRIEDTDKEREVEGSIGHIMESLKWLGIEWDEGIDIGGPYEPYLQSARIESHHRYARQLLDAGFAYPDPYSAEELAAFRKQAEEEKRPFLFRDHRPATFESWDGKRPLRLRVPEIKRYVWNDLVRGELSAGEEALDDFIIIKGDGYPTYNFAHIIDDLEMKVTHIMRSDEFISSTPKFLSLYDALDIKRPEFVTLPPILGESGTKKLGKRDGAKDILDYRDEGYLPDAMLNFLALLGWHPEGDQELFSREELIEAFEIERIQKSGAQFDTEKLLHINQQWMRKLSDEEFIEAGALRAPAGDNNAEKLLKSAPLLKERAQTFGQAREMLATEFSWLFDKPTLKRETLIAKEPASRHEIPDSEPGTYTKTALQGLLSLLQALPEGVSAEAVKESLMPYADAEEAKGKGGRGGCLWPLRYALSGLERSPDPFTLVSLLGPTESASRVEEAFAIL